jgi:hypothetical protein
LSKSKAPGESPAADVGDLRGGLVAIAFAAVRLLAIAGLVGLIITGLAEAGVRSPEVGCFHEGIVAAAYKPTSCELDADRNTPSPGLIALAQLAHLRWSHWGSRTASAVGDITYCGTGCTTLRVRVTVFGLLGPHNPHICGLGGSAYSRLRIRTSRDSYVYNVTPQDGGC